MRPDSFSSNHAKKTLCTFLRGEASAVRTAPHRVQVQLYPNNVDSFCIDLMLSYSLRARLVSNSEEGRAKEVRRTSFVDLDADVTISQSVELKVIAMYTFPS